MIGITIHCLEKERIQLSQTIN